MKFIVKWETITPRSKKADSRGMLYAYIHPDTQEILYIGKAFRKTIRERMSGSHKSVLWDYFEEIGLKRWTVLAGEVFFNTNHTKRFTSEMMSDIESLLIYCVKPNGNIQSIKSRIRRPGMIVSCEGDWPNKRKTFLDK